jgi:hypothetical protein
MKKITLSDGTYYLSIPSLCLCGCNETTWNGNRFINGHQARVTNKCRKYNQETKYKIKIGNTKICLYDEFGNKEIYPPIFDLCLCGCNEIVYGGKRFIKNHNPSGKDNPNYNNHKLKGIYFSVDHCKKISKALKGKPKSESHRKHLSENPNHHKPPKISGRCKMYYYDSFFQGIIGFKGSYEYKYVLYLDSKNIMWFYEPITFLLSEDMSYTPDFYLPQEDVFIDTKGYMYPETKIKIEKLNKEYPNIKLKILYRNDLTNLGIDMKINLDKNLHLKKKNIG